MKYEGVKTIQMRLVCGCGSDTGTIVVKNGQDCVYCCKCGSWKYNAPKTETGRAARTVATVHAAIKPKTRVSILDRANGRCELCGNSPPAVNLHVGHAISVKAGIDDMTDAELNDEENLVCLCDECNLGMGDEPLSLRFMMKLVRSRILHHQEANA